MHKYILKRLLLIVPILLGVSFMIFSIMALTPGDPASIILGPAAVPDAVAKLNHELGFDQPFMVRYANFLQGIVTRFDFGNSYSTKQPVMNEIMARYPTTLKLAIGSMLLSSLIGISLGVLSAVKQYSLLDNCATIITLILAALPNFWLGMLLILLFSINLGWLPANGGSDLKSFILPSLTLSANTSASILRLTRSSMLETIRQDYIRTAKAKGAPERVVNLRHALGNAMLPAITAIGNNFGMLMGGAVVTETIFALPGLGTYLVNGIRMKDVPVVMSATLFMAALFCVIILIVDILYAYIDPRIKAKYTR